VAPKAGEDKPNLNEDFTLVGHGGSRFFEPNKIKPRLDGVPELIRSSAISIEGKRARGVNFNAVLHRVQASRAELEDELRKLGAWEDDSDPGFWLMLEPGLARRVFASVLDVIGLKRIDVNKALPVSEIELELAEYPSLAVQATIRHFSKPDEENVLDLDRTSVF